MATPVYPDTLPGVSTFRLRAAPQVLTGENDGPKDLRRFSIVPGATADVTFRFLATDYSLFKEFYKTDLIRGLRWFWLPVPSAAGIIPHVVRFADRPRGVLRGHRYWEVTAQIELRERLYELSAADRAFFLEDFENGFDAYTSISGNTSIYTIQEGMTDHCMHCAPQTSGSVARIRRILAEPVTGTRLTFRTRVTAANSDDGCVLGLLNGADGVFSFNPIREGFYDATRRAKVYVVNGGIANEYNGSTVQLTVGRIYRIEVEFSLVSGAATYTLIDETTGSAVHSVNFPGLVPPITFDRIDFVMDSGVTTSETDYDDIYLFE